MLRGRTKLRKADQEILKAGTHRVARCFVAIKVTFTITWDIVGDVQKRVKYAKDNVGRRDCIATSGGSHARRNSVRLRDIGS